MTARFNDKRKYWLSLLTEGNRNSVYSQIHDLLWEDTVFRTLNESRRLAGEEAPISGLVWEMIRSGYVTRQAVGIRKLVDRRSNVASLHRIIADIKANRELITRFNFVSYDGLPYDPSEAKQRFFEEAAAKESSSVAWLPTSGPDAWGMAEIVHEAFDRLSGVSPPKRTPNDLIRKSVLQRLEAQLAIEPIRAIERYASAFEAHASASALGPSGEPEPAISLSVLRDVHKAIAQVANFLRSFVLYESTSGLIPTPQYDQFEHLERGFITEDMLPALHEFWHQHNDDTEAWLSEDAFRTAVLRADPSGSAD